MDLDEFFTPNHSFSKATPLLLPNSNNVRALSKHVTQSFEEALVENDIPRAPESIHYDAEGTIVFPDDYLYADEVREVLNNNEVLKRQLQTLNALAAKPMAFKTLPQRTPLGLSSLPCISRKMPANCTSP